MIQIDERRDHRPNSTCYTYHFKAVPECVSKRSSITSSWGLWLVCAVQSCVNNRWRSWHKNLLIVTLFSYRAIMYTKRKYWCTVINFDLYVRVSCCPQKYNIVHAHQMKIIFTDNIASEGGGGGSGPADGNALGTVTITNNPPWLGLTLSIGCLIFDAYSK